MIHTTHKKAIDAYAAINRILQSILPMEDARNISMLRFELSREAQFNDQEVHKILSKCHYKTLEDGRYKFDTHEELVFFEDKIHELEEIEFDVNAAPVVIKLGGCSSDEIIISQSDMEQLEGFVEFVE